MIDGQKEINARLESLEDGQERLNKAVAKNQSGIEHAINLATAIEKEIIPQLKQVQKKVSEMERVTERNAFDITLLKAEIK